MNLVGSNGIHAYTKIDHELRESCAIKQNNLGVDAGYEIQSVLREIRRGNENTFPRPLALKRPSKLLYLRSSNRSFPSLRLDVDVVQTEVVFLDDSVNAFVAAASYGPACVLPASTVAHLDEKFDDDLLE